MRSSSSAKSSASSIALTVSVAPCAACAIPRTSASFSSSMVRSGLGVLLVSMSCARAVPNCSPSEGQSAFGEGCPRRLRLALRLTAAGFTAASVGAISPVHAHPVASCEDWVHASVLRFSAPTRSVFRGAREGGPRALTGTHREGAADMYRAEQMAVEARTQRRTALVALRGELDYLSRSRRSPRSSTAWNCKPTASATSCP